MQTNLLLKRELFRGKFHDGEKNQAQRLASDISLKT